MRRWIVMLACSAFPLAAQVKVAQEEGRVTITMDGKPYSALYFGAQKPYLHPLRAASGTVVTRGWPMERDISGEAHDHPHHRGLWFGHGDVNGYDFWTEHARQQGRIVLNRIIDVESGGDAGSLKADFDWMAGEQKLLTERRQMTFRKTGSLRIVDVDVDLAAVEKTVFGDTKEAAFGIRVATWLDEVGTRNEPSATGVITNAQGLLGEKGAWGKRSEWLDYSGQTDNEKLGIAVFDNPKNPRYPTYWHARGYGMIAANIFGWRDFERDKTKDGSLTLNPGDHLRFRYRVIVHPGDVKTADIAKLYRKYAASAK